ncbi:MAG: hypothetical protein IIV03_03225 [Clostridia bacterium]|nr:hypothetical protein [Clostridia bacterium]
MYTTLKKLLGVTALATGEAKINALIKTLIAPYCDEVFTDPTGNLICLKKGNGEDKKKIMLAAHSDEHGFVATYIENNGLIRFDTCGEPDLTSAAYGEIEFENGVRGILIPEDSANLNVRRMHVDIGAKNAQEAEKKVRPGDFFAPVHRISKHGTKVCGTALDGRLACAALIKTASLITNNKDDIYFAFTGRQTVGFKGACAAVYNVCPHIAINVGVCPDGCCKAGAGAAIKLKDAATVCDRELAFSLEDAAKAAKIPYQLEINTHTASEAVSLQTTGAGAAVGGISVPAKYLHTSAETAYLTDAENAVKILCAYLGGNK